MGSLFPDSSGTETATDPPGNSRHADQSTPESAIRSFLKGFINLRTMPAPLRAMSLLGFVLLGMVALALALSTISQPQLVTGASVQGKTTAIALISLVVSVVVGAIAMAYVLAGAMQLRLVPRLLIVAAVTALLGHHGLLNLSFLSSSYASDSYTALGQLVVLALLWIWALGISLARFFRQRRSPGRGGNPAEPNRIYVVDFVGALILVGAFYGFYLVDWALLWGRGAAFSAPATLLLVDALTSPILFFAIIAPLFIYWFSTDSIEWATGIASGIIVTLQRVPWLVPLLLALAGLAAFAVDIARSRASLLPSTATVAVLAGVAALVVVLGPSVRYWPQRVPVSALVASVLNLFCISLLPISIVGVLAAEGSISPALKDPLTGILTIVIALLALIAGFALAAVGKLQSQGDLAVTGLMMVLVTLFVTTVGLDTIQQDLGITALPQPTNLLEGMEVLAALLLLLQLLLLALRHSPLATWAGPLAGPFIALFGLFAVDGYSTFLQNQSQAVVSSVVLVAFIFLAQEVWDVARSGDPITNGDSPAAPRPSRVQLYFGYILVAAALFLYGSTVHFQLTGAVVPGSYTGVSGLVAADAILLLGVALVPVTGLVRWQHWRAAHVAAPQAPLPVVGGRRSLISVLGGGGLLIAALIVVTFAVVIPQAGRSALTTYFTHLPGPNCDTHGADWDLPTNATLVCNQSDGLHVTVAGKQIGGVGFGFLNSVSSADYQVSVRVTLGATPACALLVTRGSAQGAYEAELCADGSWGLKRFDFAAHTVSILRRGDVPPAASYTLTAIARGDRQSIGINGAILATVSDSLSSSGDIVLDVSDLGTSPTTVIFSDFSYTPLA